jgi:tripartite-type tricarboxylate transporter receptor subunit TctC
MIMLKRIVVTLLLALAAVPVFSQTFPERRITLYVGYSAGGTTDLAFRALAEVASRYLGQRVVVENKTGVAATLAATTMGRAKPDGYTLAHVHSTLLRMPHMTKVDYDPVNDFTWIIGIADYLHGAVVRADAPWKTWQEFVDYAKANPRKVSYATTGVGGTPHVAMLEVGRRDGIDWVMIPYKSAPEVSAALLGGEVQVATTSASWAPFVLDGRLRLLVSTGDTRIKLWPDIPTLKDLGYGISSSSPFGIAGPKGMDPKVVATLHDAFRRALDDPDFVKTLERNEMVVSYRSTADFAHWARDRFVAEKEIVARLGLKP